MLPEFWVVKQNRQYLIKNMKDQTLVIGYHKVDSVRYTRCFWALKNCKRAMSGYWISWRWTFISAKLRNKTTWIINICDIKLINPFRRPVFRLIMSLAEILSEKLIFGPEAKLRRQMWKFEENLSAEDITTQSYKRAHKFVWVQSCQPEWSVTIS